MKVQAKYMRFFKEGIKEGILTGILSDNIILDQECLRVWNKLFSDEQRKKAYNTFYQAFKFGYENAQELQPHFKNERLKEYLQDQEYLKIS